MKRKIRCTIYTRKSTEEGLDKEFNTLEAQREAGAAYIASQKYGNWVELLKLYDDGGYSGGTINRPAMQELIADIKARRIDIIVVYKIDRLTRALTDFAKLADMFDEYGVSFVSVTQQFNTTTSMGRLMLNVLLSFAQFEREIAGERIRDKIAASKKKGMWMGGTVPLGYDAINKKLIINKPEAKIVRQIFALYIETKNIQKTIELSQELNLKSKIRTLKNGTKTGGQKFTRGALYHLIQNPIYIGKTKHQNKLHNGQHAPIITKKTWQAAQNIRQTNHHTHRTQKNAKSPSLLTGLLFTKSGQKFSPTHSKKNNRRYRYYITKTKNTPQRLPAAEIENAVKNAITTNLNTPKNLLKIIGTNHPPQKLQNAITIAKTLANSLKNADIKPLLNRVELGSKTLIIKLNLDILFKKLSLENIPKTPLHKITVPHKTTRRGLQMKLIIDDKIQHHSPDNHLIKTIKEAHKWSQFLHQGKTIKEIAIIAKKDTSTIIRTIRLAFLAPDITESFLEGNHPQSLTTNKLLKIKNLPKYWPNQRKILGFPTPK